MIALDTSFLLAAEGRDEAAKWRRATQVLAALDSGEILVPAQALAEALHVLRAFHGVSQEQAARHVARWLAAARSAGISRFSVSAAQDLAQSAGLRLEDALIVAVSEEAGARLLLSDDLPDGLCYGALSVANPFSDAGSRRLEAVFGAGWALS